MKNSMEKIINEAKIYEDFWFCRVISKEEIAKNLIEEILRIKIKSIQNINTQKSINLKEGKKGVRFDVLVEGDEAIYDIEMQCINSDNLPKRFRYYQSSIDSELLDSGEYYTNLKKSYIIFICKFDLFKKGLPMYTFKNMAIEDSSIFLNDEAYKVVLNTDYSEKHKDTVNDDVIKFLNYINTGEIENNLCYIVKCLEKELENLKKDNTVRRDFVNSFEHDKLIREEGIQQGREEVAITAIKKGLDDKLIQQLTQLSLDEIKILKDKIK